MVIPFTWKRTDRIALIGGTVLASFGQASAAASLVRGTLQTEWQLFESRVDEPKTITGPFELLVAQLGSEEAGEGGG